jgi:hypothetical protein
MKDLPNAWVSSVAIQILMLFVKLDFKLLYPPLMLVIVSGLLGAGMFLVCPSCHSMKGTYR